MTRTYFLLIIAWACLQRGAEARAQSSRPVQDFTAAKTFFQTNSTYDPRLALATDAVVIHMSGPGVRSDSFKNRAATWHDRGYSVGAMFFADSDGANEYWTGKWDGTPHPEDVEKDANGRPVMCDNRPYLLPTPGWTRYLEAYVRQAVQGGADAILPEEPLAHVNTGYEKEFARIWQERYGVAWQAEKDSPEARFMSAQLKHDLYVELEARLAAVTKEEALRADRRVPFILPVHSIYGCVTSNLTASLGASALVPDIDGYISQVWTGPINWTRNNYGSSNQSFFATAYALDDYFVELAAQSQRKLWMLVDPVEDNPNHTWAEFETWYKQSTVAAMMFPAVNRFEVAPWPERILLPGGSMGGGTPAPERFRILMLSIIQAMQDLPTAGDRWAESNPDSTEGIGVAISDALMSRRVQAPYMVREPFSLLIPLIQAGVPVSSCIMERATQERYLSRFKVIVLADELYRPPSASANTALATWIKQGGSLVIVGGPQPMKGPFWWQAAGYASPLQHLIAILKSFPGDATSEEPVGRGYLFRLATPIADLGGPDISKAVYLPLVDKALRRTGISSGLQMPGTFCLRRGSFIVAHAATAPVQLKGRFVDVLDPDLPMVHEISLKPGESGIYRDTGVFDARRAADPAHRRVLHCTHRLMTEEWSAHSGRLFIRGPAQTPAVVRFEALNDTLPHITAQDHGRKEIPVEMNMEDHTILLRFANDPQGVMLHITFN